MKKFLAASFLYLGSNTFIKGLGFLLMGYLASTLSTDQYANFGIYFSVFNIISTFSYNSIIEVIISKSKFFKNSINERKFYTSVLYLIFCAALFVLVCIYSLWEEGRIFDYNNLVVYFSAVSFSFYLLIASIIRLEEKHLESIKVQFFPALASFLLAFLIVLIYKNQISYFIGILLGSLVSLPFFMHFIRSGISWKTIDFNFVKKLLLHVIPYLMLAIVSWFQGYGGIQILKEFFGSFEISLYLFVITFSSIIQLVANSLNQVWSPKFYNIFNEFSIQELNIKCKKFTFSQSIILGFTAIGILVAYFLITSFLPFLNKFHGFHFSLSLILAAYFINIPWWQYQNYLMMKEKGSAILYINLISLVVSLSLWVFLLYFYNESMIYYGLLLFNTIRTLISGIFVYKVTKFTPSFVGLGLGLFLNFISLFLLDYF